MCRVLFILIFAGVFAQGLSFEVNFQESYPTHFLSSDDESILHKRAPNVPQFFDQGLKLNNQLYLQLEFYGPNPLRLNQTIQTSCIQSRGPRGIG